MKIYLISNVGPISREVAQLVRPGEPFRYVEHDVIVVANGRAAAGELAANCGVTASLLDLELDTRRNVKSAALLDAQVLERGSVYVSRTVVIPSRVVRLKPGTPPQFIGMLERPEGAANSLDCVFISAEGGSDGPAA